MRRLAWERTVGADHGLDSRAIRKQAFVLPVSFTFGYKLAGVNSVDQKMDLIVWIYGSIDLLNQGQVVNLSLKRLPRKSNRVILDQWAASQLGRVNRLRPAPAS